MSRLGVLTVPSFIWQLLLISSIFHIDDAPLAVCLCVLHCSEVKVSCDGSLLSVLTDHLTNLCPWPLTAAYTCIHLKKERKGDYIKEERKRGTIKRNRGRTLLKRSIERHFVSPAAEGRFHWKAVAVYRSALGDGYCEAKDEEWASEQEWVREVEGLMRWGKHRGRIAFTVVTGASEGTKKRD